MAVLKLTISPLSYRFNSSEEPELRETLIDIEKATNISPIISPNDVCINHETGLTFQGYRYTDVAFNQICAAIAPGLFQVINDITGQWRMPEDELRYFSGELAIELFNKLVRFRFNKQLPLMQFVKNIKEKCIDGVVGGRYRYLGNGDFFNRTYLSLSNKEYKFHEALLYGRHLVIRYAARTTQYVIADELYTHGFHFANSEIGGKSVRGAITLIREKTSDCALGPYFGKEGGRVIHSGREFEKKLHSLLEEIIKRIPRYAEIIDGGKAICDKLIGFGGSDQMKVVKRLTTFLTRHRMTQVLAQRIISRTISRGRDDEDSNIDVLYEEMLEIAKGRSYYDLFVTIMREAYNLPIDQREKAEQLAYSILIGKL